MTIKESKKLAGVGGLERKISAALTSGSLVKRGLGKVYNVVRSPWAFGLTTSALTLNHIRSASLDVVVRAGKTYALSLEYAPSLVDRTVLGINKLYASTLSGVGNLFDNGILKILSKYIKLPENIPKTLNYVSNNILEHYINNVQTPVYQAIKSNANEVRNIFLYTVAGIAMLAIAKYVYNRKKFAKKTPPVPKAIGNYMWKAGLTFAPLTAMVGGISVAYHNAIQKLDLNLLANKIANTYSFDPILQKIPYIKEMGAKVIEPTVREILNDPSVALYCSNDHVGTLSSYITNMPQGTGLALLLAGVAVGSVSLTFGIKEGVKHFRKKVWRPTYKKHKDRIMKQKK